MAQRSRGLVLLVFGLLAVIVCLAADALGLGSNQGIGWKQLAGAVVGAVVCVAGVLSLVAAGRAR